MLLSPNRIGQIALAVRDVDKAEAFYRHVLRLRWLSRFGDPASFDCSGVRLMLEKAREPRAAIHRSPIYLSGTDIGLAVRELEQRGVAFAGKPRRIAPIEDHDLWIALLHDPDRHTLALLPKALKGYAPASA